VLLGVENSRPFTGIGRRRRGYRRRERACLRTSAGATVASPASWKCLQPPSRVRHEARVTH